MTCASSFPKCAGQPAAALRQYQELERILKQELDAAPDAAFGGTWTYALEPAGAGTRITVTEEGYVSNPLFRVMMKAMGVHRTADGYLRALGSKLGERVEPSHVE